MTQNDFTPADETELADDIAGAVATLYTHPASVDDSKHHAVMQAQIWAQEARTQKAIVKEIGEMVGCANDWEMVEAVRNALATLPPNEHGKNRYGLDMAYFRNLFNRELNRPLSDFRPDELARVLARASRTADSEVLSEAEFRTDKRPTLGQRKAAQIGEIIGVLVQRGDGKVAAVTDLGRCTWLSQDVTGAGDGVSWSPNWPTKPASGLGLPDAVSVDSEYTKKCDNNVADGLMIVSTSLVKKWADVDAFNAPLGAAMELKTIAQMMLHRGKSDTYEQAVSVPE
jgi:hypothetical protein